MEIIKEKLKELIKIDIVRGSLLFLSLILTPSAAINILNQANHNVNELSLSNSVIMYFSLIVNFMLFFLIITDYICRKLDLSRKISVILSFIISTMITYLMVSFVAPFATKHTVDKYIYSEHVNNLANISATLQYHSLNDGDKSTVKETSNIKRDLLDNIVELESFEWNRDLTSFENATFLNLVGILIYT